MWVEGQAIMHEVKTWFPDICCKKEYCLPEK